MFSVHSILFHEEKIITWDTDRPDVVSRWIRKIERFHHRRLSRLIVSLDTEWCPNSEPNNNPRVAILQLCVDRKCLIFQPLHAMYILTSLFVFLANVKYTFVGVGVDEDARKLTKNYGLDVSCTIDVGYHKNRKYYQSKLCRIRKVEIELGNNCVIIFVEGFVHIFQSRDQRKKSNLNFFLQVVG
ncbi:hypothetical protein ACJRO7_016631 [Eucalyptus globulus]|uniref:3'-5' exonuclease domain-containing protein n=1 Tax=Eucalyptus globulus TaxID=34317 RepID=A0ABD3LDD2_EUCGL